MLGQIPFQFGQLNDKLIEYQTDLSKKNLYKLVVCKDKARKMTLDLKINRDLFLFNSNVTSFQIHKYK